MQEWMGAALESALPSWLGSFQVVRDAPVESFLPGRKYIFGYVHHGLYPLGEGCSAGVLTRRGVAGQGDCSWWLGLLPCLTLGGRGNTPQSSTAVHNPLRAAGAGYIHNTPSFRRLFPGLRFCTLSASVLSVVLIIRDIGAWMGVRVVKRRTFVSSLREGRSVLVVPGGQVRAAVALRRDGRVLDWEASVLLGGLPTRPVIECVVAGT